MLLPQDISFTSPFDLKIVWNDGHTSPIPVRRIRLDCPCASCVDEVSRVKVLEDGSVPPDVRPLKLGYAGKYALTVDWSDGHNTGYYTFEHLRKLCGCDNCASKRA